MSIRFAAVTAILVLIGSYDASAQDVAPCPTSVVPARAGGLELIGWQKFPRADAGAVFNYRAVGSFGADVYLYPGSDPLDGEVGGYKENLQVMRDRGDFEAFQVESERELPGVEGQPTGRHVVVMLRRGNQSQRSHFYVFPSGAQHVKVRITYPEGRFTDEAVQTFIGELLGTLPKHGM